MQCLLDGGVYITFSCCLCGVYWGGIKQRNNGNVITHPLSCYCQLFVTSLVLMTWGKVIACDIQPGSHIVVAIAWIPVNDSSPLFNAPATSAIQNRWVRTLLYSNALGSLRSLESFTGIQTIVAIIWKQGFGIFCFSAIMDL